MDAVDIILSHFFVRGNPQSRWRDSKTGRFVKTPEMFRYTLGISHIPYGQKYYGFTLTVWSLKDFNPRTFNVMFIDLIEKMIGYPYVEWWFKFKIGYEVVVAEFDEKLTETWEFYVNDYLRKSGNFHFD